MTSVQKQEDLEARIERIKKRNEEIEKKYREAEADRLAAMKENAMVEIKPPKDEDWPREHKYDKVDFNYDLDPAALAQLEEKKKEKNAFIQKIAKEYKVFAEGEGPPPDPAYSFLADVERDGEKAPAAANGATSAGNVKSGNAKGNFDRRNPNNRSGRQSNGTTPQGMGPGNGPPPGRGKGWPGHNGNLQRSQSTNEHDGWRGGSGGGGANERMQNGSGHNKSTGDGRWRRDNGEPDRAKDDGCLHSLNGATKADTNLTVSVSQDGEFKSVKVTSPPIIGSGRVGPRQPAKPQFQFLTNAPPGEHHHYHHSQQQQHHHHHHQQQHHGNQHQHHSSKQQQQPHHHQPRNGGNQQQQQHNDNFNRNTSGRKSDKDVKRSKAKQSAPTAGGGTPGSVQDRLNRNRIVNIDKNDNTIKVSAPGATASTVPGDAGRPKATLKTISKIIEKNAEIDEKLAREMMQRDQEKLANRVKEIQLQE